MKRQEIVKDLRARGWAGEITAAVAREHGYTVADELEWNTPEPSTIPAKPKPPPSIAIAAVAPAIPAPAIPAAKAVEKAK